MLETMIKLAYVLIFVAGATATAVIAARFIMVPTTAKATLDVDGCGSGMDTREHP